MGRRRAPRVRKIVPSVYRFRWPRFNLRALKVGPGRFIIGFCTDKLAALSIWPPSWPEITRVCQCPCLFASGRTLDAQTEPIRSQCGQLIGPKPLKTGAHETDRPDLCRLSLAGRPDGQLDSRTVGQACCHIIGPAGLSCLECHFGARPHPGGRQEIKYKRPETFLRQQTNEMR